MTELERCDRCNEVCCMCCPKCHGTGDDHTQPIAAAGRCGRCLGTGRRSKMDHPLAEDAYEWRRE